VLPYTIKSIFEQHLLALVPSIEFVIIHVVLHLIPLLILIFVLYFVRRRKLHSECTNDHVKETSEECVDVYRPTASPQTTATGNLKRSARCLTVTSVLSFLVACCTNIRFSNVDNLGIEALIIGWLTIPFWTPNPLYFTGLALAYKRRFIATCVVSGVASIWALTYIITRKFIWEVGPEGLGPAPYLWTGSMFFLLAASITFIIADAKLHKQHLPPESD
jgi:hypothetical protein